MKYERLTQWTENGASLILDNPQNAEEARAQLMEKFKFACNKLADLEDKIEQGTLIEQKTCKNISEIHPVDGFTCSECGISLEDYSEKEVDEESGDITYREYMLRYCPNCGAKVVEE